ncbi:recombinase family protein [Photobacterium swingsii]|uniref:recombinase family protein n=1 Tax=Photobacterium swingsii TaxID=680026 RepID=UPI00352D04C4
MKLIAYIRVSSQNQVDHGDSLAGQEESINKWATNNGHTIIRKYIDAGSSAYNDNQRPQFNIMLREIDKQDFDCDGVIVYSLSRFSRSIISQAAALSILEKNKIRILSVVEPLPEDYMTYKLLLTIFGVINEMQSKQNSATVCDRLQGTADKGYFTGGTIPYGYESVHVTDESVFRKKLVINEEEAKVVRKIYELATKGNTGKGWGLKKITSYLNDNAILNRGDYWKTSTLHRILHNTIYYGERIYGRKRVERSGKINPPPTIVKSPEIISKETFDNVKRKLKSRDLKNNKDRSIRSNSLLTGIIKCGLCNANLVITTGKSGNYKYYTCGNKVRSSVNSCNCKNYPKDKLEEIVKKTLLDNILIESVIIKILNDLKIILRANDTDEKELRKLNLQLKSKQGILSDFYKKLLLNNIEFDETVKMFISSEQNKLNNLKNDIDRITCSKQITYKKFGINQIRSFIKSIRSLIISNNSELTKSFLISLGMEVKVYPKN